MGNEMDNKFIPKTTTGTISDSGAKVTSVYGESKVKVYGVHEPELETISHMNTATVVFFSIGSFCLQNIVSGGDITWDSLLNPSVLATLCFFIGGIYTFFTGKSTIGKIKDSHKGQSN